MFCKSLFLLNLIFFVIAILVFINNIGETQANEHGKRLFDNLVLNYNRLRRPADSNGRLGPIQIRMRLRLSQIIDLHEIDQTMTVSVWLRQSWFDPRLAWKPNEYGGIGTLYVPHEMIWVPDIVLYNNAAGHYSVTIGTKATLHYTGEVLWEPPALFKSQCQLDVQWFPFDEQICQLKFGSWSYSEDHIVLAFWEDPSGKQMESEYGIDLSDYYPSVEWDIMSVRAIRHSRSYPGRSSLTRTISTGFSLDPRDLFSDIVYNLVLRRKPLFYTVNMVFPCVGISFLTILVFYLPSESGEKVALCISILVALTVFFLLLTEVLPASSVVLPLIGKYLLFTMFLVTLSVLITVFSLNLHFRKSSTHLPMSNWFRKLFLRWLPKMLLMRRPLDAQAQLRERARKKSEALNKHLIHVRKSRQNEKKKTNKTVAHLQAHLQSDCLGPIRVLRDTPLDAFCRPPFEDPMKQLMRSPRTVAAFKHVCFIAELLKNKDRDIKVDQDWKYVANVLDRLFLVLFALSCFLGTAFILLQAPIFYDRRQPIDLMQFQLPSDNEHFH